LVDGSDGGQGTDLGGRGGGGKTTKQQTQNKHRGVRSGAFCQGTNKNIPPDGAENFRGLKLFVRGELYRNFPFPFWGNGGRGGGRAKWWKKGRGRGGRRFRISARKIASLAWDLGAGGGGELDGGIRGGRKGTSPKVGNSNPIRSPGVEGMGEKSRYSSGTNPAPKMTAIRRG